MFATKVSFFRDLINFADSLHLCNGKDSLVKSYFIVFRHILHLKYEH